MKTKLPESLVLKFINSNFSVKKTTTGELRINSPFVQDKKYHLYIEPKKGVYTDFKSGESGKIEKFISDFLEVPEGNLLNYLVKEYGIDNTKYIEEEVEEKDTTLYLPDGLRFFKDGKLGPIGEKALKYLRGRKLSEEVIGTLGYIYNPDSVYNESIFIPFYENNEMVYFLTRDFTGKSKLRYKNPDNLNTKNFVFNIDNINETVLICEGPFDAMSVDSPVATCMMSATLGRPQITKILEKDIKNIIFVPDNDETGERTLEDNIQLLLFYKPPSVSIKIYIYRLPKGIKDLNDLRVSEGAVNIKISDCEEYSKKIIKIPQFKKFII